MLTQPFIANYLIETPLSVEQAAEMFLMQTAWGRQIYAIGLIWMRLARRGVR